MVIAPWESYNKCLKDSAVSKRVPRNSEREGTSLSLIVRKRVREKQERKRVKKKREKTQMLPEIAE